jgi:hypothetical protein
MIRAKEIAYTLKVLGKNEGEAKRVIGEEKLKYRSTIRLTPDKLIAIIGRALTAKIEPDMTVDLVTDRAGKALFYVPAVEVPEMDEFQNRIRESEKIMREEFQIRLQESEKAREELKIRLDENVKKFEERIVNLERRKEKPNE